MTRATTAEFIDFLWLAFWIYWLVSAARAKRTAVRSRVGALVRGMIIVVIIIVIFASGNASQFVSAPLVTSIAGELTGAILVLLGLALAAWARVHLGRNWGMPMTLKENPELVTSGPYRFVRHPIYSGVLLAMVGSALIGGVFWFLVFIFFGIYFIYSAKNEEKLMLQQFPDHYPAYMKRSKMLIPWVL